MTPKREPTDSLITGQKPAGKDVRAWQLRREMTPMEKKLWYHLRGGRLDGLHFRRQLVADGFIVDFYCHEAGLVVEVDGGIHLAQAEYDAERDAIIRTRDLCVLRVTNAEVEQDCPATLARIRHAARARLDTLPPQRIKHPPDRPLRISPSGETPAKREEKSAGSGNNRAVSGYEFYSQSE